MSADIEAHGVTGSCSCCATLASHGRATKPHKDECRERIRTIIESILTGRQSECIRASVKEMKRARVERAAGDVPMESGNTDDEQMAVRHADASDGDITENQHEETRMRDIHLDKRTS